MDSPTRSTPYRYDQPVFARLSTAGVAVGVLFFSFSLTPSLIPRDAPYQAIASGLSLISGYALGTTLGWLFRKAGVRVDWTPQQRRRAWLVGGSIAVIVTAVLMVLGAGWQNDLRQMMGLEPVGPSYGLVVGAAVLLAALLLVLARLVRLFARWIGRLLSRLRVPVQVARVVGGMVMAVVIVLALDGLLYDGLMSTMEASYSLVDQGTAEGVVQPEAPERSGSPASPVAWDSLGLQGRTFVAGGRSVEELGRFSSERGSTATPLMPIRVYAGLDSTEGDLDDVAALVVSELDRTNAWDREVLVVTTATGTGWVDPAMSESVELMYAGGTAIAAMQYSFLPSWVSFVADRETPPAAGKALFEAVYEAWEKQAEDDRPLLLVFGVSLGSYGAQGAFASLSDVTARTDGALFVGTPYFTDLWRDLTESRDRGSYQWSPVYQEGREVRWGTGVDSAANVWELGEDWERPRVVYLQHASDGVVWWTSELILHRPDWIVEPKGPDVLPYIWWMPLVTFWQVSMDQFVAGAVPAGHGHNYQLGYVDAWSAVAPPEDWEQSDTDILRARLAEILPTLP